MLGPVIIPTFHEAICAGQTKRGVTNYRSKIVSRGQGPVAIDPRISGKVDIFGWTARHQQRVPGKENRIGNTNLGARRGGKKNIYK